MARPPVTLTVDQQQILRAAQVLKAAGETRLSRDLSKRMRACGQDVVELQQNAAQSSSMPARFKGPAVAAIKATFSTSQRNPGVDVRLSGRRIPGKPGDQRMPKLWNRASFRHPVWASESPAENSAPWVEQVGDPDWWSGNVPAARRTLEVNMRAALAEFVADTNRKLAGRG
jgi:hypothetical protein